MSEKGMELASMTSDSQDGHDIFDPNRRYTRSQDGNKHLRMLKFANPGKFMEDFDPERSSREMRKMNRRIYRDTSRRNQLYDEHGYLWDDGRDLCDCLDQDCPGCHFLCQKCDSTKCGAECRCNRRWIYQEIEIEIIEKDETGKIKPNKKLVFPS